MMLIAIKTSWFIIGTGIIFSLTSLKKKGILDYWSYSSLILLHWLIGYKFR